MNYTIKLESSRCIACGACIVACMDQNDLSPQCGDPPLRSCIRLEERRGGKIKMTYMSLGCRHCDNAPCIAACPSGCIHRDEETGFVVTDVSLCIGCRSCLSACPNGVPGFDQSGLMRKCDGCFERVKQGMEPACVRVCPYDALTLTCKLEL